MLREYYGEKGVDIMLSFEEWKEEMMEELPGMPMAEAMLQGSAAYPELKGMVTLFQTEKGVLVVADIHGLPEQDPCGGVFGFHIHEGNGCGGDDFADTKGHYNPKNCLHPYHAGDLPPLFSNRGSAWMAVLTDRFQLKEVIGRTIVIHLHPDDFMTQPAGNSGMKIACGVIQ